MVVFGKEVFYGQGINSTLPGRSHVSTSGDRVVCYSNAALIVISTVHLNK